MSRFVTVPWPEHLPKLQLIDRKINRVRLPLWMYVRIIFQISLRNERMINIVRGRVGELEEKFKKSAILFFLSKRIANSFEF